MIYYTSGFLLALTFVGVPWVVRIIKDGFKTGISSTAEAL